jgi:uncharacterized protein YycO
MTTDTYPNVPIQDYATLRPRIRSGDILLCSGTSVFSQLIQTATQSVWSHVAFVIRLDAINRIMVLESVETIGVRTVPLSSYVRNYNGSGHGYPGRLLIARHADFANVNIGQLSQQAVDLLGYPYDSEAIAGIAARIGLQQFNVQEPNPEALTGRAFICSEYVYACYRSVGIDIPYDTAGFIAPSDFAKDPQIQALSFISTE